MKKIPFENVRLDHAPRLINHGPTVLITSAYGNRRNVMAAAWSMPVNFDPPRVAVVIDASAYTRELVTASGTFGICVPGKDAVEMAYSVGTTSGRDRDKFAQFGIDAVAGPVLGLPMIETGCCGWMECRILPEARSEGEYDTFFAEVVAAAADPRIFFNGRWSFDAENTGLHTIHHVGGGNFAVAGDVRRAKGLNPSD